MKTEITLQSAGTIGSGLFILVVAGLAVYFYMYLAAVPKIDSTPKGYTAAVLTRELEANGMFTRAAQLLPIVESEGPAIQYSPGDLGKNDITKLE